MLEGHTISSVPVMNEARIRQKHSLKSSQDEDLTRIKVSYFCVVQMLIRTLKAAGVSPVQVIDCLQHASTMALLGVTASTINELFAPGSPLSEELDWKNLKMLAVLVDFCKSEECQKAFREYNIKVILYNLKHGSPIMIADNSIAIEHLQDNFGEKMEFSLQDNHIT